MSNALIKDSTIALMAALSWNHAASEARDNSAVRVPTVDIPYGRIMTFDDLPFHVEQTWSPSDRARIIDDFAEIFVDPQIKDRMTLYLEY